MESPKKLLIINPLEDIEIIKAIASEPRMQMLALLRKQPLNIN
ncbi:MAG TPA: ArsR family transcriptional regulator, partial [Treponema sp.]|nr:ArsR family transcriptional regulator [Treponema sp.]